MIEVTRRAVCWKVCYVTAASRFSGDGCAGAAACRGASPDCGSTHALMYGAVLLIALTVAVSVLATLSASLLERRRDFALMKALAVLRYSLSDCSCSKPCAACAGWSRRWTVVARWRKLRLARSDHTATLPRVQVLPWVLVLNVVIAAMAALFPARCWRRCAYGFVEG